MMQSQTIGEIAKALSKAQGEFSVVKKECENPFFKSKYADLAACIDATRAALSANGLAVIQLTKIVNDKTVLETTIAHSSGEFITGEYLVQPTKQDPQAMGSALTYARRFSFCGMLSIAAEAEDDDGNNASGNKKEPEKTKPFIATISENQALDLVNGLSKKDAPDFIKNVCKFYKVKEITDIPAIELPKIIKQAQSKPDKKEGV
jgi:hypothetical protein